MAFFAEYCTLADLRADGRIGGAQIDLAATKDDTYLLRLIRQVSREIDDASAWECFAPIIDTRYYDRGIDTLGRSLFFRDAVLLELTSITNGAWGVLSAATDFDLRPNNFPPYSEIRLRLTSGIVWMVDTSGNSERAISVTGVWGFSTDYGKPGGYAWQDTGGTVQNNPLTAGGTSLTVQTGKVKAGQLLKLGTVNDFAYASSVTTGATDTVTLMRSVNGSTGVQHAQGEAISFWTPGWEVEDLCMRAVQIYYKMRSNPEAQTISVNGTAFTSPKDVNAYISQQVAGLGLNRPY